MATPLPAHADFRDAVRSQSPRSLSADIALVAGVARRWRLAGGGGLVAGHRYGGADLDDPMFEHRSYDKWKAYGTVQDGQYPVCAEPRSEGGVARRARFFSSSWHHLPRPTSRGTSSRRTLRLPAFASLPMARSTQPSSKRRRYRQDRRAGCGNVPVDVRQPIARWSGGPLLRGLRRRSGGRGGRARSQRRSALGARRRGRRKALDPQRGAHGNREAMCSGLEPA